MVHQPHLHARPTAVTSKGPVGLQTLPVGGPRDSYLYVPPQYDPSVPMPMALMLHGAGGHAHDGLRIFLHLADQDGLMLLAPASNGSSWDIISRRTYGPDVMLIEQALRHIFSQYAVDATHLAIGGFSDGASYALTLGLANGDLFTHVIAFSPGFIKSITARGEPKVFISHGTHDDVLPIQACSRSIVPKLRSAQYAVVYDEFEGAHIIPPEVARLAMDWFTDRSGHASHGAGSR